MQERQRGVDIGQVIHVIIGCSIMFFGRFLSAPTMVVPASEKLLSLGFPQVDGGVLLSITPLGVTIVTLFIGVIYLWTFVDTLWPGFLGVILLGMSDYASMPKVLGLFMGNPMSVMIFFLFVFAAILIESNLSVYLARWFMTRKLIQGKPWLFTATILVATYAVAFLEQTTSCFLMWPALYIIFDYVGLKKGDTYVSMMIVYTMIMALLSFATDPIKGGAFYLLSNMHNIAVTAPDLNVKPLNLSAYLIFGFIISFLCIAALLLVMRFVFKVDVSPLKNLDFEVLQKDKLPPLTIQHKIIIGLFFFYALWLLLPGIIGKNNLLGAFLSKNALCGTLVIVFLASAIHIKKRPVADITKTNAVFPWKTYFLVAVAFLLGGAMTSKATNVTIFMEYLLRDSLYGMDYTTLGIAVILIGILLTNFFNSVVAGLVLSPVLLAICNAFGFSPGPIMACFFYVVLVAAATPAASPFAAILYDNSEWISTKDVARHTLLASGIVVGVLITVGLPLSQILFN